MFFQDGFSKQAMSTENPAKAPHTASKTIAFRVDLETDQRLRQYAAASGCELSDFMRELVRDRLEAAVLPQAGSEDIALKLESLHRNIAQSVRVILTILTPLAPTDPKVRERAQEHAREWVEKIFGVKQ